MELYEMMKNISGRCNENVLIDAIDDTKNELNGLVEERMCKIYSSYLYERLKRQHISVRIINTLDLGIDYEHYFLLVLNKMDGYYLVDLTFSQFNVKDDTFAKLEDTGYQVLDDNFLNKYLYVVSLGKYNNNCHVTDLYFHKLK